jgi:peptidylprolyl isomerase
MRFIPAVLAFAACLVALPAAAQKQEEKIIPNKPPEVGIDIAAPAVPPPSMTDKEDLWVLDLSTGGRVTIWLRPDVAPKMVERIKTLTREHFYDGLVFHRVIDGFMAQGGDPLGDGTGESKLPDVPAEFNNLPHVRGAVSAAREDSPDSANSQFFIMFMPRLGLDRKYTVFGRVIDGMQYVDAIERGEPPAHPSRVLHAWIAADNPPAYQPAAPERAAPVEAPVTLPGAKPAQ